MATMTRSQTLKTAHTALETHLRGSANAEPALPTLGCDICTYAFVNAAATNNLLQRNRLCPEGLELTKTLESLVETPNHQPQPTTAPRI